MRNSLSDIVERDGGIGVDSCCAGEDGTSSNGSVVGPLGFLGPDHHDIVLTIRLYGASTNLVGVGEQVKFIINKYRPVFLFELCPPMLNEEFFLFF